MVFTIFAPYVHVFHRLRHRQVRAARRKKEKKEKKKRREEKEARKAAGEGGGGAGGADGADTGDYGLPEGMDMDSLVEYCFYAGCVLSLKVGGRPRWNHSRARLHMPLVILRTQRVGTRESECAAGG